MIDWKTISSTVVHKNPWFSLREDKVIRPDGKDGIFYVMDRPSCVIIVPLSKDNEVYLIRINRYTTRNTHWEIPMGSSENQDKLTAAKREMQEETGLESKNWIKAGIQEVANGVTGQIAHIFIAKDVAQTNYYEHEEEGIDKIQKFSFSKVMRMIEENEIIDSNAIAALMLAGLKLKLI